MVVHCGKNLYFWRFFYDLLCLTHYNYDNLLNAEMSAG
ncbi:hypothetical protein CWATWH0402_1046 [Crocosphaera watsonii WH 0402]|uniref:Uncharacterized protein n=1 Tax=Crocosphaera watsonii WH 0402 TaxID=1284629 RepID=T2JU87_CROWT|nr:hypothetical protein CWATWH0402_1046 [Crocosphaera watsonii WH 0402]